MQNWKLKISHLENLVGKSENMTVHIHSVKNLGASAF